ncbi:MAG: ribonuclease HI [Crocinitomicaceae bacterium]|nr:ribonuclease HI [Crocinitomicaceae bacterium]MDC1195890.1 ribonuclease HI [Crocinitomicaceae bacterium]|tara:strand:+ start:2296 stop:2760 length:465 start_codon:yes stop_codon:yes gene_type:complete
MVNIYTDGSAKGNPGNGGYGIVMRFKGKEKEMAQGFRMTTNNRMELLAVIVALETLTTNKFPVKIYSDSKYVIDSITKKWVFGWEKKNFKGKKNVDLWKRYLAVQGKFNIEFEWVKGHAGHPENERCDVLAFNVADDFSNHLIDEVFEKERSEK